VYPESTFGESVIRPPVQTADAAAKIDGTAKLSKGDRRLCRTILLSEDIVNQRSIQ
jgi:hypothetical protein